MTNRICCIAIALSALLIAGEARAVSPADVPNPRRHKLWVSDTVDMIEPATEAELERILDDANQRLGVEIAVVTVQTVDAPTPKDFATDLFNTWGIGQANKNNGLLVLMVQGDRRLEMETGYGTETVLTDGWLKRLQTTHMVPHFKSGDFGRGLLVGVERIVARLDEQAARGNLPEGGGHNPLSDDPPDGFPWWWALLGVGGVGAVGGGWAAKRRHDRQCPSCKQPMVLLPEDEDDAYLTPGQQTEEAIDSIDWQYWYCEECDESKLRPSKKWFSGYSRCPACHHRTLATQTTTQVAPTYMSTGLARITEDCAHCSHHRTRMKTLPRRTPPSSSSSSGGGGSSFGSGGGSSFGGGSSGGGGSGSSW